MSPQQAMICYLIIMNNCETSSCTGGTRKKKITFYVQSTAANTATM